MDSKEKLINDCIKAVCVNGEDLKKYKPDIDGTGLYEKCEKFVAVFRELKGTGQLSNVAANKLRFQGKQIGLAEDTIKMLRDILEGKAEPVPEKVDVPSAESSEDNSLLTKEIPVEKTLVPVKKKKDPLRTLKHVDVKKCWSAVLGFVKTNKKWIAGIAAVVVVFIGIMLIPSGESKPSSNLSQEEPTIQTYKKLSSAFELSTVEYHVKVVHYERDPRKIRQDRVIAIVTPAKVIAGIDLSLLSEKDVTINGNSIEVRMPKAKVMGVEIEREKMKVSTYPNGIWTNDFNAMEISEAKKRAQVELENKISEYPILSDAQEHAEKLFRSLLEHLGYETITINFV